MVCYDEAIKLNASFAAAWESKSRALDEQGRHPEAERCLEKAIQVNPDRLSGYWNNRAWYLLYIDKYYLAKECINKFLANRLDNESSMIPRVGYYYYWMISLRQR